MVRCLYFLIRQNSYFLVTFVIGVILTSLFTPFMGTTSRSSNCVHSNVGFQIGNAKLLLHNNVDIYEPRINLAAKPKEALKTDHGMNRPRFHKTELGIKNKIFLGVLTSPESISSLGVALNKTSSSIFEKVMFFIDAPSAQRLNVSLLKLPGIVGFTDTRLNLKPFHLLKYVADNFLENYDFFFIVKDAAYIHAQRLSEFIKRISVNQELYMGKAIETNNTKSGICSLDFGVLLSNLLLKKMHRSLDWCVKNFASNDDSLNLGHCISHTTHVKCSQFTQGSKFYTYRLRNHHGSIMPINFQDKEYFEKSIVIAPIKKSEHFYLISLYFSMLDSITIEEGIEEIKTELGISLEPKWWPLVSQPVSSTISHFDVLTWDYFRTSHKFLSNDFFNLEYLLGSFKGEMDRAVNISVSYVELNFEGAVKYHNFINGYQRFDHSRGMEYMIDVAFRETTSGQIIQKRLETFKSLGKVEIMSVPYVTENVRVHLIIPVKLNDRKRILMFLKEYSIGAMEKKDLQFLMLVFIYSFDEGSKGEEDIFKEVKNNALLLSNKFERTGNFIKWHSIKLPANRTNISVLADLSLDFVIIDSVIKKFSLESLLLLGRPNMKIQLDYFNRVRMNTIFGHQVFSPIPFSEYNPNIIYKDSPQPPELDINKNYGHYDFKNFKHISFYAADYLQARKKVEDILPLHRYYQDVRNMTKYKNNYDTENIYNVFIKNSNYHVFRAVEPSLQLRYSTEKCVNCRDASELVDYCTKVEAPNLATRNQLGRLILDYQNVQ